MYQIKTYIKNQFAADFGLDHLWCILHAGKLHSTCILSVFFLEQTQHMAKIK